MKAAELVAECRTRGIWLQALDDGQLNIDAPEALLTPELVARLREHKTALLALLTCKTDIGPAVDPQALPEASAPEWLETIRPDGRRTWRRADLPAFEVIDFPTPCAVCGGLVQWQDLRGGWHCEACEPRTTGPRLRALARKLRWHFKLPPDPHATDLQAVPGTETGKEWPPEVPEAIAADPCPACSDCGRPVIPGQPGRAAGLCCGCWMKTTGELSTPTAAAADSPRRVTSTAGDER